MLTNKFKAKARSIALKSFVFEMKKLGLYRAIVKGSVGAININGKRFIGTIEMFLNKKEDVFIILPKKVLFKTLEEKFKRLIDDNYYGDSHRSEVFGEEYNYLVHCVNALIYTYIEHGVYKIRPYNDIFKTTSFERIGESVFNRAAKKIFGDDFQAKNKSEKLKIETRLDEITFGDSSNDLLNFINTLRSKGLSYEEVHEEILRSRSRLMNYIITDADVRL